MWIMIYAIRSSGTEALSTASVEYHHQQQYNKENGKYNDIANKALIWCISEGWRKTQIVFRERLKERN